MTPRERWPTVTSEEKLDQIVEQLGVKNTRRAMNAMVVLHVVFIAMVVAGLTLAVGGPAAWVALGAGSLLVISAPAVLRRADQMLDRYEDR